MTKIMIIGSGSAELARSLRALAGTREFVLSYQAESPAFSAVISGAEDVFTGGRRSKGEKKRAASERRMRGGY